MKIRRGGFRSARQFGEPANQAGCSAWGRDIQRRLRMSYSTGARSISAIISVTFAAPRMPTRSRDLAT